jgi:hypothetical protein
MSYHPNIPQANDDPTVSQGQLLDNYGKMNTDFGVNHVPLTAGANNGFHTLVQFPTVLVSDPAVSGLQSALYPKADVNNIPQLFFENLNVVYQLTNLPFVNGTITGVVVGANGLVTSDNHQLATGNQVTIIGVNGVTGINGMTFTITVVNANQFNINAAVAGGYINGGTFTSPQSLRFGFRTPWGWIINTGRNLPGSNAIQYSIPYPMGFVFYGGYLTPESGANQFGLNSPGTQTGITFATNPSPAGGYYDYLIIGSG